MVSRYPNSALIPIWRRNALAAVLTITALLVAYFETYADIVRVWWTSSTFNHGFLIIPIAVYLGMSRRQALIGCTPSVSYWGLVYVALNAVLWTAGDLMSIAFFKHAAAVGMIIGACWALIGNHAFKILLFPFFYLYFAVPEGEFLVPHLQDWTARVLEAMLRLTQIPVFIEGRYLSIPSGDFVVAEACSGINYLIATVAVGAMFAYLNFVSLWRRLVFMAFSIAVPLLANGLRAYGIVMIAHLSDYKYAMGVDHFIYGGVFFAIVVLILFSVGNAFSDISETSVIPERSLGEGSSARVLSLVAVLVLSVSIGLSQLLVLGASTGEVAPKIALPQIPGWVGPMEVRKSLNSTFPGLDQYERGEYRDASGAVVTLEFVYFRAESSGAEVINQINEKFETTEWKQMSHRVRDGPPETGVDDFEELTLRAAEGEEFLVWQWYDAAGHRSVNRLRMKLQQLLGRLVGHHRGAAMVSIMTSTATNTEPERALRKFAMAPEIKLERIFVAHGQTTQ